MKTAFTDCLVSPPLPRSTPQTRLLASKAVKRVLRDMKRRPAPSTPMKKTCRPVKRKYRRALPKAVRALCAKFRAWRLNRAEHPTELTEGATRRSG